MLGPRPSPGGLNVGQDDFAVVPHTTYQKQFGIRVTRARRGQIQSVLIAAVPDEDVARDNAIRDVESIMRIRHGLRLDEPNDFDLMTQDAALRLWDQVSQATYLALVAISSIALMVGGIGVMAIMTISVKERTREIGTRRALGARRREVLLQFLLEAVFLTAVGASWAWYWAVLSVWRSTSPPAFPFPCRGGPLLWASASPRRSASFLACFPPSAPPVWTRSKPSGMSSHDV